MFTQLCPEMITAILEFCSDASLLQMAATSREIASLANDNALWKPRYTRMFDYSEITPQSKHIGPVTIAQCRIPYASVYYMGDWNAPIDNEGNCVCRERSHYTNKFYRTPTLRFHSLKKQTAKRTRTLMKQKAKNHWVASDHEKLSWNMRMMQHYTDDIEKSLTHFTRVRGLNAKFAFLDRKAPAGRRDPPFFLFKGDVAKTLEELKNYENQLESQLKGIKTLLSPLISDVEAEVSTPQPLSVSSYGRVRSESVGSEASM